MTHSKKNNPRKTCILNESNSILLIIDIQEKLIPVITEKDKIICNAIRLIDSANILNIPIISTEQSPQKLGPTINIIKDKIRHQSIEKSDFSCTQCNELMRRLTVEEITNVIICGIESHICVLQTAINLIEKHYQVHIIVDSIGSRNALDKDIALKRLQSSGAILSTTETAIFELCKTSNRKEFKSISNIIKQNK